MCARSLRELARRTLRSRGVIIRLPDNINREENLAVRLSDLSPSLYFGIEYKSHNVESIVVTNIGQGGGVIGSKAPDESDVWVPMDLQTGLDLFIFSMFWTFCIEFSLKFSFSFINQFASNAMIKITNGFYSLS